MRHKATNYSTEFYNSNKRINSDNYILYYILPFAKVFILIFFIQMKERGSENLSDVAKFIQLLRAEN